MNLKLLCLISLSFVLASQHSATEKKVTAKAAALNALHEKVSKAKDGSQVSTEEARENQEKAISERRRQLQMEEGHVISRAKNFERPVAAQEISNVVHDLRALAEAAAASPEDIHRAAEAVVGQGLHALEQIPASSTLSIGPVQISLLMLTLGILAAVFTNSF
jgi:hypothetical protein